MLLVSFGPRWICQWLVLTLLVLPLLFCARRCCRWPLLPTGFVGPTGVAALLFWARWFCRLCCFVHWFCHCFCVARWFCHFLFVAPPVLPHVCLLARPLVLPPILGISNNGTTLIILAFTLTLYPLRHGRARGGELARHEAAALAADTAAVFLVFCCDVGTMLVLTGLQMYDVWAFWYDCGAVLNDAGVILVL